MATDQQREKALTELCKAINKSEQAGGENHDAVTWLGSRDEQPLERFSTGCVELDVAMGGGWPRGRIVEVYGPESCGKTTLALHSIAEHQVRYPAEEVGLIDLENAFDPVYARNLKVDTRFLLVSQPDYAEQAMNVLRMMVQLGVKFVILDSVAGLATKAEVDGDMGDAHVATQARLMSSSLRAIASLVKREGATVLFTNQVREKIGVMYGSPITTPGGRSLRHWASVRVSLTSPGKVTQKVGDETLVVATKIRADVVKNKTSAPFKRAEFYVSFGHGIDKVTALFDSALAKGVVERRGSWFALGDEQLGQGRQAVIDMLRGDEAMLSRIQAIVENGHVSASPVAPQSIVRKPVVSKKAQGEGVVDVEVV